MKTPERGDPLPNPGLGAEERAVLLSLARVSLQAAASETPMARVDPMRLTARLRTPGACFVTLHRVGKLRGCIGTLVAKDPLYQAVIEGARSAATRDVRFPPVRPDELKTITLEVSVLTEPHPLSFSSPADLLQRLAPHRDGVVLHLGNRKATYLPQVWDQLPDPATFLDSLARKAGCEPGAWQDPAAAILTYHVEAFGETAPGHPPPVD